MMRKTLIISAFSVLILALVGGCSNEHSDAPTSEVNSGSLNTEYVGDPHPVLVEDFKQSEVEAQLLEEIRKKNEDTTFEGDGLAGH